MTNLTPKANLFETGTVTIMKAQKMCRMDRSLIRSSDQKTALNAYSAASDQRVALSISTASVQKTALSISTASVQKTAFNSSAAGGRIGALNIPLRVVRKLHRAFQLRVTQNAALIIS